MPPKPTLASHNKTISLGQPLTLDCRAEGHPPPSYAWFLFSSDVREQPFADSSRYVQYPNGTLRVSRFDASDFDDLNCQIVLLCSAENAYGESRQYYTLSLDRNGCATVTEMILSNRPSVDPGDSESQGDESAEEKKKKREAILIGVFSGVLLCLAVAVVLVFVYLLSLCHRRYEGRPHKCVFV